MKLTTSELAKKIDQTLLKPFATYEDLHKHCETAAIYGFKTVAINNVHIPLCANILKGSGVLCDSAVSFPLGQSTLEIKVFETCDAISKGAGEVDYVINISALKSGDWEYIRKEMSAIVTACKSRGVVSKVIFENCYLTKAEICRLCDIALDVRPTYIKTSTGFGTGGATIEDVRLMKQCVGNLVKIKAAGGIRSAQDALAFLDAGADRIGTSAGVAIIEQYLDLSKK